MEPIGVVRSPYADIIDEVDWHEVISEIHVNDDLVAGLQGIELVSHIVVMFYLHKFRFDPTSDMLQTAKVPGLPPVGIFARRSNRRPNSIGTTTARLLSVHGNILRVRGLDALDGSPVLDIKPYAPPPAWQ